MDKTELLADLEAKSGGEVLSTELVETIGAVKRYTSNVLSIGAENNNSPIGQIYSISFLVKDEGEEGEVAYYTESGFKNPLERNPTGSTLLAVYGIFSNSALRERVVGAIAKAVRAKLAGSPSAEDNQVVKFCATDFNGMVDLFMGYVASNATIQANGGAASDSDLDYVVQTEAWLKIGAALSL